MLRDFTIVDSLALRAVRVKPISCALRACFLGHYRMARMSQSASSCGLASWMRTQECNTSMIPDTHSLKLLFPTQYTSRSIYLCSYQSASSCRLTFWIYIAAIYYCDAPASLPFHKKSKHPHTIDKYSHKSNGKKILTVLRRNSIIIVNCSAEDI